MSKANRRGEIGVNVGSASVYIAHQIMYNIMKHIREGSKDMNVIGELGTMIIKYQQPLGTAVIVLAVLLVIFIIVKIVKHAKKKEKLLSEINCRVAEISTTVSHLNEKKTEVIFIDNRLPKSMPRADTPVRAPGEDEPACAVLGKPADDTESIKRETPEEEVPKDGDSTAAGGTSPERAEEIQAAEDSEEKVKIPLKFSDRSCAVSKQGRVYTIEELNEQIKE